MTDLLTSYNNYFHKKSEEKETKNIKYEIGKYYLLNLFDTYFIPSLQTRIKFQEPVAVKLTNFFMDKPCYGKLVVIKGGGFNSDLETDIDIELSSLGKEYQLNSNTDPIFYMDFLGIFNNDYKVKIDYD